MLSRKSTRRNVKTNLPGIDEKVSVELLTQINSSYEVHREKTYVWKYFYIFLLPYWLLCKSEHFVKQFKNELLSLLYTSLASAIIVVAMLRWNFFQGYIARWKSMYTPSETSSLLSSVAVPWSAVASWYDFCVNLVNDLCDVLGPNHNL